LTPGHFIIGRLLLAVPDDNILFYCQQPITLEYHTNNYSDLLEAMVEYFSEQFATTLNMAQPSRKLGGRRSSHTT